MYHFIINKTHLSSAVLADSNMIHSKLRDYGLNFAVESALDSIKKMQAECRDSVCIFDQQVYDLYFKDFKETPFLCIKASEDNKCLETVVEICQFFSRYQLSKSSQVIVIGGGIVQEVSSFAAAMYKRGLKWRCMPTTLLSMADSCLGGKTSLNMDGNKNLLGLYYPPSSVVINPIFLKSLSEEAYFSGMGEILKHHILAGEQSFTQYEISCENCSPHTEQLKVLALLKAGLGIKRTIIEHDEFERDVRRALNYGHSIGHVIESISNYEIPHGLAITIGILVENQIAVLQGYLEKELSERIQATAMLLLPASVQRLFASLSLDEVPNVLGADKKIQNGILPCSSLKALGNMHFDEINLKETALIKLAMTSIQKIMLSIPSSSTGS